MFVFGDDPVRLGLVTSLARPSGNLTGINFYSAELVAKRLELLRELVPAAKRAALLVNPEGPTVKSTIRDFEPAARAMGLRVQIVRASNSQQIDAVFASFVGDRPDVLFVGTDPYFTVRRVQIVHLATRYGIPTAYPGRQFPDIGGLLSYGSSLTDTYRQLGIYAGRILKGAKPADLPVLQTNKFELVINAQIARMLGLVMPPSLLARADEVIE